MALRTDRGGHMASRSPASQPPAAADGALRRAPSTPFACNRPIRGAAGECHERRDTSAPVARPELARRPGRPAFRGRPRGADHCTWLRPLPTQRGQRLLRRSGTQSCRRSRTGCRLDLELCHAAVDPAQTGLRAVATAGLVRCRLPMLVLGPTFSSAQLGFAILVRCWRRLPGSSPVTPRSGLDCLPIASATWHSEPAWRSR